ncbi:Hypothetical protein D9617_2g052210 [Elsinoe fawcettii]|nr:Hypothetical protein D9617_2g052210 [Elsinoe fawcettii]
MSSQTPSTQPEQHIRLSDQPSRTVTATPNLIARGDSATIIYPEQPQYYQQHPENNRTWAGHGTYVAQQDEPQNQPRDRLRSYPTYGQPVYSITGNQGAWGTVDPRFQQRLDQTVRQPTGPPQPAYPYPQQPIQYSDPRYGQDVRFYTTDVPSGQQYSVQGSPYDASQQPRFRQATYPIIGGSPATYEPPPLLAIPHQSARVYSPDFSHVYTRPPVPGRAAGHERSAFTPPQYGNGNFCTMWLDHSTNTHGLGLESRSAQPEPTPSYPRGPPRKPKQSGFAVWVGNLSPGTTILDLKDYFSRGATKDIESVFLISKSNCAFVNYKTAESAQAAVSRFHDSRFHGARLVCRLRHGQAPTSTTPPAAGADRRPSRTDPLTTDSNSPIGTSKADSMASIEITEISHPGDGIKTLQIDHDSVGTKQERVLERYFIVKSLTLQDLEASVRDGIWATQSHNETALKEAFESAQHVYLIFSANKSGEYFGYARMKSNINPSAVTVNPRAEPATPAAADGPTSTATPATEHAPRGRVVDDSARGTIFWEADSSSGSDIAEDGVDGGLDGETDGVDDVRDSSPEKSTTRPPNRKKSVTEDTAKSDWGRPFQIEWLSTSRLPFYRTRGLRNPWNANREVKIARDGTELEPSVGRRLLDLFHQSVVSPSTTTGISYNMSEGPMVADGSTYSVSSQQQSYRPS